MLRPAGSPTRRPISMSRSISNCECAAQDLPSLDRSSGDLAGAVCWHSHAVFRNREGHMKQLLAPALMSVALICVGSFAAPAFGQSLTAQQQLARDIYKELVEIDTVTETGDTGRAADAMAARLRAAGFGDSELQVFKPAPGKGNLVARLRGTGQRKPILLLAHLDVVPANREDWSVEPFKFLEQDGYFYSRGTG